MVNFRISICLVEIYQSSLAIESSTRILEIWLVFCTSGTKHIYTVLYNGSTAHGLHEEIDFSNPLSEINQPMRSFWVYQTGMPKPNWNIVTKKSET